MGKKKRVRVPDPEDPEYWYPSRDSKGSCLKFNLYQYIEDFRKWKVESQQRYRDIMTGPKDPWKRIQELLKLLKEILEEPKEQNQIENIPKDAREAVDLLILLEFRVGSLEKRMENLEKEISRIREASK